MTALATEDRHPSSTGLHAQPAPKALALFLSAQILALESVYGAIPALERAADAAAGGRCATTSSMPAGTGGSIVRRRWCGAIWRGRGS